jgi:hypothetical protein
VCPPDNSYTNIQKAWTTNGPTSTVTNWPTDVIKLTNPDLRCTDRCHNGEYDGSYPQAGRYQDYKSFSSATLQPAVTGYSKRMSEDSALYNYAKYVNGWTTYRLFSEECDTGVPGGDACCNKYCRIVSGCTCTHYMLGIRTFNNDEPRFRSSCSSVINTAYYILLPTNPNYF